ncbi:LysR family transcriptional regulator [Rhizobium sp. BK251]|uniref:LysR family transcriptional regulator n=1 Tax=Rhizobium sp. BK251 TaxID=2512125 RepID=UPI0010495DFF|nr:LysR family transcriptional regulator [Rhizobium sp. BK251]TCL64697.1 LysR family transcriptional regulator [Rhizobium sp. BK251]
MLDDLNELKTFQKILAEGSLSGAARALGTSLAVVSKRLATLERRTGVRLVNRTTRSLSPTEEGARFLVHVDSALEALLAAEEGLVRGRDEPVGLLRVSAPVTLGRRHVAPVLGDLCRRHSQLSVSLTLNDLLSDLVGEGIDVAVRIGVPAESSAVMRKLAANERILVASPDYLDRVGRPSHPSELKSHILLGHLTVATPWALAGPGGEQHRLTAEPRFCVDNGDAILDWALAGHGIMNKSQLDVAEDLGTGRLERVLPAWTAGNRPIVALFPSARHLPTKTRVFLDEMVKRLSM